MKFFSSFVRPLRILAESQVTYQAGKNAMELVKKQIEQKSFHEALKLLDRIEKQHPEYFKASIFYRGEASYGLLQQLNKDSKHPTLKK